MNTSKQHLKQKGWSDEEIKEVHNIMSRAEQKRHPKHKLINELIYWGVVSLGIFTVIGSATWLMPIFVFTTAGILYPLLIIIALGFGLLFNLTVHQAEELTLRHHVIISSIIPVVGVISFLIVVQQTNALSGLGGHQHNALLVGVIFTTFFIMPYIHSLEKK